MGGLISLLLHKSGWARTATEEAHGHDLTGKVAIVTGATSGIGLETARVLARAGARVILACRNVADGEQARGRMMTSSGHNPNVLVKRLDLASLRSIRNFAAEVDSERRVDFLVLNAGVMGLPLERTKEGFEAHLGMNYLGHRHLAQLLLPKMRSQDGASRVVIVTCSLSKIGSSLDLRDLGFASRKYEWWVAYNQSKEALWLYAKELSARLKGSNVSVYAADPGRSATGLTRYLGPIQTLMMMFESVFVKSEQQGAASVVHACVNPKLRGKSGAFVKNCRAARRGAGTKKQRCELWDVSERMIADAKLDSWGAEGHGTETAFRRQVLKGLDPILELVGLKKSKKSRAI